MKNLKEFLSGPVDASVSKELALKKASSDIASVVLVNEIVNSEKKSDKFAQEVTKLASSDQVILELSDKVGAPLPSESEDEFVARAKQSFKKILMARLSDKKA